jgi:hypothetical protein
MALEKLSAMKVARLAEPGFYSDGGGLYLRIAPGGTKGWIFRFKRGTRQRDMGLGPLHTIGLKEAREEARECRRLLRQGVDPIDQRDAERGRAKHEAAARVRFETCAKDYIAAHQAGWKNAKHAAQWPSTMATYVYPVLGKIPVQEVTTELVLRVIEPIWESKTETATRVRMRIEAVLDWATAKKLRAGDNPARWHGLIAVATDRGGRRPGARVPHPDDCPHQPGDRDALAGI